MVGIVIVSHSARLAAGVAELANQMVQGKAALAVAGGIDDPENPIGTDAMAVHAAIESVYSNDGVVVLMDLGSALLSAELALEFLTPEQQERVYLVAAPLVEGALAAAVQAAAGAPVAAVIAEANGALAVKQNQLQIELPEQESPAPVNGTASPDLTVTIRNPHGLHARPAALLVQTAGRFAADITIYKGQARANAKSINQVATLGARAGDTVAFSATGSDADAALEAIAALAAQNFGESLTPAPAPAAERPSHGPVAAAPGIALGPAFQFRPQLPPLPTRPAADPEAALADLRLAIDAAVAELETLTATTTRRAGAAEAAIFDAHRLILTDPDLLTDVAHRLRQGDRSAAVAWREGVEAVAAGYEALDDSYQQARAADVRDAGDRVLRHLLGVEPPALDAGEPVILLARDLSPSDTARLDPQHVLGVATEEGGATGHSAILARALGIPAVVGIGPDLADVPPGTLVGLDGETGIFYAAPTPAEQGTLRERRAAWLAEREAARAAGAAPAVTADGKRVEVAANIGGPHDLDVAEANGAEGVGLFRTEFLFMDREVAPTEEEQLAAYRAVARRMGNRPVIIRTLDVGGDKPLSYVDLGREENPFLGWRGIRFCLEMPEVLLPQLRAILRATVDDGGQPTGVRLMFPMVSTIDEIIAARRLLDEACRQLRDAGRPFNEAMEIGVMIEVPAAAAAADLLAPHVDFFSIGTNDLTQYTMAADRGNARVAPLIDALQPAVLRLIKQTADAAHAAGIWVGMCGELAGNAAAAPLLLGLGLDELSMSAPAIPAVKAALRATTTADAAALAAEVLTLESAAAVRRHLA